uniref:EB domain-containing protein n=1 Tax=Rhabditophanes sp. KR3021 TaxID=114890 RepID=A0AC35UDG5_9BILA
MAIEASSVGLFEDCLFDPCSDGLVCTRRSKICVKACTKETECPGSTCGFFSTGVYGMSDIRYCVVADEPNCSDNSTCALNHACSKFSANCNFLGFTDQAQIGDNCASGTNKCAAGLVCNPTVLFNVKDSLTFTCTQQCSSSDDCVNGGGQFYCNTCGTDVSKLTPAKYCEVHFSKRCVTNYECPANSFCNLKTLQCIQPPNFCF